jgi:hypothetical protein
MGAHALISPLTENMILLVPYELEAPGFATDIGVIPKDDENEDLNHETPQFRSRG